MALKPRWQQKIHRMLETLGDFVPQDVEKFLRGVTAEEFKKNSILYSPGDVSEQIYFLLSGAVALSVFSSANKKIIVHIVSPGSFFGYSAFLRNRERFFCAEAFTDIGVAVMTRDHFLSTILRASPRGQEALCALFVESLFRLALRQVDSLALNTREQVLAILGDLARDFGIKNPGGVKIDLKLPHETLAALTGASRQRISVVLAQLEKNGVIKKEGGSLILLNVLPPRFWWRFARDEKEFVRRTAILP